MNELISRKVAKQKMSIFITLCIIAMISMIGYTYSFFQVEISNTGVISGEVESVNLQLTVTKVAPSSTKKLIPQLDSAITKAVVGRNGSCIDDNNNAVCQVYKVTLTNAGTSTVEVDGYVGLNAGNNPNLKWTQVSGDGSTEEPTLELDIYSYSNTTLTTKELYQAKESKTYYIVIWISETGYAQMDSGQFTGVVKFGTHQDVPADTTLSNLNLTSNGILGETDDGTIQFTGTSCSSGCSEATVGIYEAEDDLGKSYYFRGDVENNYVKFGKNSSGSDMYWRIVRINGDGTVRMIYDGTQAYANGTSSTNRQVGTIEYNTSYDDNAYVGYMYGTPASDTYEATHANTNNSTMKTYLEGELTSDNTGWYYENIVATGYSGYIADAIYCADKTVVDSSNPLYQFYIENVFGVTMEEFTAQYTYGNGYGTTEKLTIYGYYGRASLNTEANALNYVAPTLKCANENDRFTVEDTVGTVTGNSKNKYPVGLLTNYEAFFAGGYAASNESYYLYTGQNYWTMSPTVFVGGYASVGSVNSDGYASSGGSVNNAWGVRPVVSLKSDAIKSGTGTSTDPFKVT